MNDTWWKPIENPEKVQPIPWMHPAAVAYLETLLRPTWTILEQGCGGSTIWFAGRVAKVISVENDIMWLNFVRSQVGENVTLIESMVVPLLAPRVDLVYIDGKPNTARIPWIHAADQLVKPGGIVVLDNSDDPEYEIYKNELHLRSESWVVIRPSFPLTGYDTTFYRMPGGAERLI